MDPALLCRVFFTLGTVVSIGGTFVPFFKSQIMNYGSRATPSSPHNNAPPHGPLQALFAFIASIQVPHSWFTHYYIASVASSAFWAYQIWTCGSVLRFSASYSSQDEEVGTSQVLAAWTLMAIQGTRRLYESIVFAKPSQSRMWIGLWILGIAFYLAMGLSVWIEGIAVLAQPGLFTTQFRLVTKRTWSVKSVLALIVFLGASIIQYDCHKYLASLKKYSLPNHAIFRYVVCPHYTCECLIYVSIAIVSAPTGRMFNGTVLAGLAFVVSNLAVTADGTREWYVDKFSKEALKGRWRMVPYLY